MASTIAAPVPLHFDTSRQVEAQLISNDKGRETPLPQYEKTQSVPFTLDLQEDRSHPGRFQLVVNVEANHHLSNNGSQKLATFARSPTINGNLDKNDSSTLYHTRKQSPPTSPLQDKQGWSDLNTIPSEFLQKVVPDWNVTFSRSDSTASTQSKTLADIKARIKKKGKGYVVRLLKGSSLDPNDVAEVDLGQGTAEEADAPLELDSSSPRAELYAAPATSIITSDSVIGKPDVFEIGTSNEPGIQKPLSASARATVPSESQPPYQTLANRLSRHSIIDDSLSDAETLIPDIHSVRGRMDGDETDYEPSLRPSSLLPVRTSSTSSIVKTPTRGLSVVGPVRRVEKSGRVRVKGKTANLDLRRSDAHKSIKRRPQQDSILSASAVKPFQDFRTAQPNIRQRIVSRNDDDQNFAPPENNTWQHMRRQSSEKKPKHVRHSSAEDLHTSSKLKTKLRLQTDIARPVSTNTSPVAKRKKHPKSFKPTSSSPSSISSHETKERVQSSGNWSEVDGSSELRDALRKAFEAAPNGIEDLNDTLERPRPIPSIMEPVDESKVGEIPLPPELEIRSLPVNRKNPLVTFWSLAFNALAEGVHGGFKMLQDSYGAEPPVPAGHVRVRWTCACGDSLYDDFVERRPGAARLLEAYLNRRHSHTSRGPASGSSSASSVSSIFDTGSRASTLATPLSTYGGASSWGRNASSSKPNPSRIRTNSPFSVRIGSYPDESWLLTCANEGRFTPKIVHLDVNEARVRSDKDLALVLREHYEQLNRRLLGWVRLRGLTTIEFVQFEIHRNRFADIRAAPSMPPVSFTSAASTLPTDEKLQLPSQHPYSFEPIDLLPPVGSTYLLHLFRHPNDYDGELITYLRCPKRRERLDFGMGWGINFVEGFLASRVWIVAVVIGIGSAVFAILWTIKKGDVQGAFGVAGWVLGIAGLLMGGLQAWLE